MGMKTKLPRCALVLFTVGIVACSSGGKSSNPTVEAGVGGQQDARSSTALDGGTGGVGGVDAGSMPMADAAGGVGGQGGPDAATGGKLDAGVDAPSPDSRRSDAADAPVPGTDGRDGAGGSGGRVNSDASTGGKAGAGGTTVIGGTTSPGGTTASAGSTGTTGGSTSPGGDPSKNKIGINIGSSLDYQTNRVFADAMKTSREWQDVDAKNVITALDEHGWPTQDASICVWHGISS